MSKNNYSIAYNGLKEGFYLFDFKLQKAFFTEMEVDSVKEGDIDVNIQMEKKSRMLIFDFHFSGTLQLQCDRCLEDFVYEVDKKEQLIVQFGEKHEELSEDLLVIDSQEVEVDLKNYIYEYITIAIPYKKVHPMDEDGMPTCNNEVTKLIEKYEKVDDFDPRWEKLKNLKNK